MVLELVSREIDTTVASGEGRFFSPFSVTLLLPLAPSSSGSILSVVVCGDGLLSTVVGSIVTVACVESGIALSSSIEGVTG